MTTILKPQALLTFPGSAWGLAEAVYRDSNTDNLNVICLGFHDEKTIYEIKNTPTRDFAEGTFGGCTFKYPGGQPDLPDSIPIQLKSLEPFLDGEIPEDVIDGTIAGHQIKSTPIAVPSRDLVDFFESTIDRSMAEALAKGSQDLYLNESRQASKTGDPLKVFAVNLAKMLASQDQFECRLGEINEIPFKMILPTFKQRKIFGYYGNEEIIGQVRVQTDNRKFRTISYFGWIGDFAFREKYIVNPKSLLEQK